MSEKHYPYIGGSFDRIVFDGDGSVWVPELKNAKLRAERDEWHRVAVSKQDVIDHMHDARTENAKLLELLKNALTYIEYEGCGVECPETGNSATLTPCDTCNRYETESCAYVIAQSARELGLEAE